MSNLDRFVITLLCTVMFISMCIVQPYIAHACIFIISVFAVDAAFFIFPMTCNTQVPRYLLSSKGGTFNTVECASVGTNIQGRFE